MLDREGLRVLVCYDRTDYFIVKGEERGFEYELLSRFGETLKRPGDRKGRGVDMVFLPLPEDRLLKALAEGRGDIAAVGLTPGTAPPGVVFTEPYVTGIRRVLVTHRKAPRVRSLEDLAGRTIHLLDDAEDRDALRGLNERLRARGLAPVRMAEVQEDLEREDLYELTHAGILDLTLGLEDSARLWSQVLTDLVLIDPLPLGPAADKVWAVRADSPHLLAALNAYVRRNRKGTFLGNILFKRYYKSTHWIQNPVARGEREKLDAYRGYFQTYARQYGLDWLAVAAQAYQESRLDQARRSGVGAVGLMQLMPRTAAHPPVSIPDITRAEANVHAGVKYMAYLLNKEFRDPAIDPDDRYDFALAAYNAGPARVHQLRKKARAMGLDPNQWFRNVERAALKEIGLQTVRYVANIRKYRLAYQFAFGELSRRTRDLRKDGLHSADIEKGRW